MEDVTTTENDVPYGGFFHAVGDFYRPAFGYIALLLSTLTILVNSLHIQVLSR